MDKNKSNKSKMVNRGGQDICLLNIKYPPMVVKEFLKYLNRYSISNGEGSLLVEMVERSMVYYKHYLNGKLNTKTLESKASTTLESRFKCYLTSITLIEDLKRQGLVVDGIREINLLQHFINHYQEQLKI